MSTAAAGGEEDGNGGGDPKGKNKNTTHDPKKMSTLERSMLRYMQGKTADVIARGEKPPCNDLYAPIDMHHYLQQKLQMPLQEERNLLMVVFMLRVVFTVLRRRIARMAKY
jgi:hypothetical protein